MSELTNERPCLHSRVSQDVYDFYRHGYGRVVAYPCLDCGDPISFGDAAKMGCDGLLEPAHDQQAPPQPDPVCEAGQAAVIAELERLGFSVVRLHTLKPGAKAIEAASRDARRLVQVKAVVAPNMTVPLSPQEGRELKARARNLGAGAWEARLHLTPRLELKGSIRWRRLK